MIRKSSIILLSLALLSGAYALYKQNNSTIGQLILPQITGMYYRTSSGLEGHTKTGNFNYLSGDTVTFFLGNAQQHYALGTVIAQPQIAFTQLSNSSSRTNNLLRLLAALDNNKNNYSDIELVPLTLAKKQFQKILHAANWHVSDIALPTMTLPSIEYASQYIRAKETYEIGKPNNIVLEPLNRKFQTTTIRLRNKNGKQCFYDLSKVQSHSYKGPIGHISYKVVNKGIYLYPDIGDYYGSWDNSVDACDINTANQRIATEFEPITNFEGFKGVVGCAHNGCTQHDLSGFTIDDYGDDNSRKYRTVALSFNPITQLVVIKTQGLGPKPDIQGENFSEGLSFTSAAAVEHNIIFSGIWQETSYSSNGDIAVRCLLIDNGKLFASPDKSNTCANDRKQYELEVTKNYADMWWLTDTPTYATLGQLNTPVKWFDQSNSAQYTTWEYLPAGSDWQSGVLHRFSQTFGNNKAQGLITTRITEYIKISD